MQTNEGRHSKSRTPPVTLGRTHLKKELRIPNKSQHSQSTCESQWVGFRENPPETMDLSNGVFRVNFALNQLIERRPPCRSIA
jgi:hypothetical protein